MKQIITLFVILIISIAVYPKIIRTGDTFKVEQTISQDTKTKYLWEDKKGNKHSVYITSKGTCYIIKISKKTGKPYRQYLPKEVQETIRKEINFTK